MVVDGCGKVDVVNSKRKGNAGELELLHLLEAHGLTARRNDQRYTGGVDNPDLSCTVDGMPIHIECKRTEKLSLYEAMNQAERDANGHALPVVVHRRSRKPWLVVIKLDDLLKIVGKEREIAWSER